MSHLYSKPLIEDRRYANPLTLTEDTYMYMCMYILLIWELTLHSKK